MTIQNFLGTSLFMTVTWAALSPLTAGALQDQGSGGEVLVIEGGTLIDGTGSTPKTNMRIVIRNGRIQNIGPRNQVSLPARARVINARGKFILPGLIDSHVHYFGYEGELYLNHGVTTVMSLGGIPEWDRAQGEAMMPTLGMPHWLHVRNREEGIQVVQMLLDKGVDYIKIYRGVPTAEVARAMAEQAHRAGKRVVAHLGPNFDAREAALAGVDLLAHASGVLDATIKDPELKKRVKSMSLEAEQASLISKIQN
jgi:hypothetical protein